MLEFRSIRSDSLQFIELFNLRGDVAGVIWFATDLHSHEVKVEFRAPGSRGALRVQVGPSFEIPRLPLSKLRKKL